MKALPSFAYVSDEGCPALRQTGDESRTRSGLGDVLCISWRGSILCSRWKIRNGFLARLGASYAQLLRAVGDDRAQWTALRLGSEHLA